MSRVECGRDQRCYLGTEAPAAAAEGEIKQVRAVLSCGHETPGADGAFCESCGKTRHIVKYNVHTASSAQAAGDGGADCGASLAAASGISPDAVSNVEPSAPPAASPASPGHQRSLDYIRENREALIDTALERADPHYRPAPQQPTPEPQSEVVKEWNRIRDWESFAALRKYGDALARECERLAKAGRSAEAWTETAAFHCRNEEYYRGLLDSMAPALGDAVYISDDGSRQQDPLRAKMPELVNALAAECERLGAECDDKALSISMSARTVADMTARASTAEALVAQQKGEIERWKADALNYSKAYGDAMERSAQHTLDLMAVERERDEARRDLDKLLSALFPLENVMRSAVRAAAEMGEPSRITVPAYHWRAIIDALPRRSP